MKAIQNFLLILSTALSLNAYSALRGDAVNCQGTLAGDLKGLYSLDYLRAVREGAETSTLAPLLPFYPTTILSYLGYFTLGQSTVWFFTPPNPSDFESFQTWEEASFGLAPVPHENLAQEIPKTCKTSLTSAEHLIQMRETSNATVFSYDSTKLNELKKKNQLQHSMILLRNWLEQFTNKEDLIYQINILFHRKDIHQDKAALNQLGVLFGQIIQFPRPSGEMCSRTIFALEAIERGLQKSCDQIQPLDLSQLTELEIRDQSRVAVDLGNFFLRSTDLANLVNLKKLSFQKTHWLTTSIIPGFYSNLLRLEDLTFERISFLDLRPELLPHNRSLKNLIFSAASLDDIAPGSFVDVFDPAPSSQNYLEFGTLTENLGPQELVGLENLKSLKLVDTSIKNLDLSSLSNLISLECDRCQIDEHNLETLKTLRALKILDGNTFGLPALPLLETLALEHKQIFRGYPNPQLFDFLDFPRLKNLELKDAYIDVGDGVASDPMADSGHFQSLQLLQNISFQDATIYYRGNNVALQMAEKFLPSSVQEFEFCDSHISPTEIAASLARLKAKRPQLKISIKNQCLGEWYEFHP